MKFCLLGKEINYSLSPIIHNYHFQNLGIKASFELLNCDNISKKILLDYNGFNVTIPFKEEMVKYCENLSIEAKQINAVNCVKVINKKFYGYNTDIYGFYMLLKNNKLLKGNKKVLVIGAGGAGKAVYYALDKYTDHLIFVTNRTSIKAKQITQNIIDFNYVPKLLDNFDIVINCTNVGVKERKSPIEITKIKPNAYFIDINYLSNSLFLEKAKNLSAKTINGIDMLIYQAQKSFEIWLERKSCVKLMYEAIERMC